MLGLATRLPGLPGLPGLRRVDLQTNHRCAPEIVRRAARLVEHNQERFDKRILASPAATREVRLAPNSGDDVAHARRLLTTWPGRVEASHAILARTNDELAPYAAVARECGIAIAIADDRLLGNDTDAEAISRRAADAHAARPIAPLLAVRQTVIDLDSPSHIATAVLG